MAALTDPKTVEIMLNADGKLWQGRLGEKMRQIGTITTTLHANNARVGLGWFSLLISIHPDSPRHNEPLIGEAVQLFVHIARTQEGRRVTEIIEIQGFEDGKYITKTVGV